MSQAHLPYSQYISQLLGLALRYFPSQFKPQIKSPPYPYLPKIPPNKQANKPKQPL